ncbi:hypothetical protein [Streptomyces sp. enrichment culture]
MLDHHGASHADVLIKSETRVERLDAEAEQARTDGRAEVPS